MKRKKTIILIGILFFILPCAETLFAQNQNEDIVIESEGDDVTLSIAGFQFTFGENNSLEARHKSKARKPLAMGRLFGRARYGYIHLDNNKSAPLENGRSAHYSGDVCTAELYLNRSRTVSVETGLQVACDDYVFQDNVTLKNIGGTLTTVPVMGDVKYSRLAATYMGIPLYLNISLGGGVEMSLMSYMNYLVNSYTQIKVVRSKRRDERFDGLKDFQYGVGAAVHYEGFGIYVMYSLSPLFDSGIVNSQGQFMGKERGISFGVNFDL